MRRIKATDARSLREVLDNLHSGPVVVTRYGTPSAVIVTPKMYAEAIDSASFSREVHRWTTPAPRLSELGLERDDIPGLGEAWPLSEDFDVSAG
ncbi:MAG: type II toxin-antitoxin system Phd/YefM family antitoxin [bacterium]|nr:type II toxin-antitoxin system Phd/YefM family antitoxin [bacterium]